MSEWMESAVKRRDFRSVKDRPETHKARAGKKKRTFLLWIRIKPEELARRIEEDRLRLLEPCPPGLTPHLFGLHCPYKEWAPYGKYATPAGIEQAKRHHERDPYHGKYYEFKITHLDGV